MLNEKIFRKIGWAIVIFNILAMLNSMNYFLFMAKFPISAWLAFNACFPSTLIFLLGFFTKNKHLMAASIPFLAFFGILGLTTFGWSGTSIFAQFGHIFMTLATGYILIDAYKSKEWKKSIYGFIAGIILFVVIFPFHQAYIKGHPEFIEKLGDAKFEEMMKK